jgi:hypothetical protein
LADGCFRSASQSAIDGIQNTRVGAITVSAAAGWVSPSGAGRIGNAKLLSPTGR